MNLKSISRATVDSMSDGELRAWFTQFIDLRDKEEALANAKKDFDWGRFLSKDKLRPVLTVSTMSKTDSFGWLRFASDLISLVAKANCEGPSDDEVENAFIAVPDKFKHLEDKAIEGIKKSDFCVRWDAKGNEYLRDFWQGDFNGSILNIPNVLAPCREYTKTMYLDMSKVRNALKRLDNLYEIDGRDFKGKKYKDYGFIVIPLLSVDESGEVLTEHMFFPETTAKNLLYVLDKFGTNQVKFSDTKHALYVEKGDWMAMFMPYQYIQEDCLSEKNKANAENYYFWRGDEDGDGNF